MIPQEKGALGVGYYKTTPIFKMEGATIFSPSRHRRFRFDREAKLSTSEGGTNSNHRGVSLNRLLPPPIKRPSGINPTSQIQGGGGISSHIYFKFRGEA